MYDWPEVRAETEALEKTLQDALIAALGLDRKDLIPWPDNIAAASIWNSPSTLLTQTCGYPLTHALCGKVRLLGVPHYAAEGCDGPNYCSQLVVSRESPFRQLADLRGKRAAYNGPDSQSGMNAFRHAVAPFAGGAPFFSEVFESGSHLQSLEAVAEGRADIASIDAVCWFLAGRELPDLAASLRPIGRTASAPGLPLITSLRFSEAEAETISGAVAAVLDSSETAAIRERLGICGFSRASTEDYSGIIAMEQEAVASGYPTLD